MITIARAALLFLISAATIASAQPDAPDAKPVVEKIDATHFKVGAVTFDSKTREIRFPASINMTKDLLEFLIVHKNGKVHESLLKTEISPTHLNLAFTLLRYQPSPELYSEPTSPENPAEKFPEVAETVKKSARILIEVEWQEGDRLRKVPLNEWIQHGSTAETMPAGPWVYGGSEIVDGKYPPEVTGDIAAIFRSQSALINYPGKDNANDDVWFVFPKRVPPLDSPVTVIITPFSP